MDRIKVMSPTRPEPRSFRKHEKLSGQKGASTFHLVSEAKVRHGFALTFFRPRMDFSGNREANG
jgi:hypothetical protein